MRTSTLLARNLAWYWRTNLAVLLGVVTATAVLAGALLVGGSVRASLRDLALARLGNTDTVVARPGFFGEELADGLGRACPIIALNGVVTHEPTGRRAGGVEIYAVDERFWAFQTWRGAAPRDREALLSPALARELGAAKDDPILVRAQKASAIPLESLHGRKEDTGKTMRLAMSGIAPAEFSLRPQQGELRAIFMPLDRAQRELSQARRVNTILAAGAPNLSHLYSLSDVGLKLRTLDNQRCLSLESDSALLDDTLAETTGTVAASLGLRTEPVLTYLANSIRVNDRDVPYSVVTATDSALAPAAEDSVVLNDWTARDLGAKPGDPLSLEYYVWKSDGRLHTETAQFRVDRIVPLAGAAADRDFAPDYPGITEANNLRGWDPPFPLDLSRVRPEDEQYWDRYRTTPKAFVRLAAGRRLWGTRFGSLTSIRIYPPSPDFAAALREAIDPAKMGLTVMPVRRQALDASQGSTDFGEYFVYFSFFLMVSALLLTGLFFKFGVEQRSREIGVLRALGFPLAEIRTIFLLEGAALATAGALAGMAAAPVYCALILHGLRTWWIGAVGTTLLSVRASVPSLAIGGTAGIAAGLGSVAWTLRRMQPLTPRGLLAGGETPKPVRRQLLMGSVTALVAVGLLLGVGKVAGFFGAGSLLLISALLFESAWLRSRRFAGIGGRISLGFRGATHRPGRSVLCIALIASATFVIVSLDAFRRDGAESAIEYPLMAESVLPLVHDPNTKAGREALNLPAMDGVEFRLFRLRPGDDASCLNLYRPNNPRILAASGASPWPILDAPQADGAVPVIADANSLEYVLHLKVGEAFEIDGVRFRVVDALRDSLFQSELLISEKNFLRLFPRVEGFRFFLLKAPASKLDQVTGELESALSDYGFDAQPTSARIAGFHRVENTYLSTFRALGALGLALGVVGLAAILLRNALERRRELALLRAVGFRPGHLAAMALAENVLLLTLGLATGAGCALIAVVPAVLARGGHIPALSIALLLGAVLAAGVIASLAATAVALRSPVLAALRSE